MIEKKNISLVTLCTQLSLAFVLYSNQSKKSLSFWLKEMIANMAFVMELYLCLCLDFNRIHIILIALIDKNEEWSWTTLCETLSFYGQRLESTQAPFIQIYFDRMNLRCQTTQHCDNEVRIHSMLVQLIEFRKNGWQNNNPILPVLPKNGFTVQEKVSDQEQANGQEFVKNTAADGAKSYASLVKTTFCNGSKKRLHVVAYDEKPARDVAKTDEKKSARNAKNSVETFVSSPINLAIKDEKRQGQ